MYKLPTTLSEDINYFGTLIDEFNQGKIEPVKFKGTRVPMGIYEQRKDGTYMVRVRCTGGYISPLQLRQVALTARNHQSSLLHLTTRQEIQIHHILIQQVKTILPELQQVALSSKGGGGNTVRNILVDIESGISSTEEFDVLPYAVDLTTHLIAEPDSFTLPRKLKIAFATSAEKADFAVVNDLGFVAKTVDGQRGFEVYLGGSVASNPSPGWKIFDFVPVEDIFNVAIAAKQFFNNHGNRKNKHKARIRYIFYKEGEEKTRELYFSYYNEIKSNGGINYNPSVLKFEYKTPDFQPVKNDTEEFNLWKKRNAKPQPQAGLYSTIIAFVNGNTDSETLLALAEFAESFGNDVLRFTARQQLQFRNIPEAYLPNLFELIQKSGLDTNQPAVINNIVSCTGADTCRLGICYSKGASLALRKHLSKSSISLDDLGSFQINISGCPNSCAQQIWSDLGFSGRVARNDRMYAAYNVYAGAVKNIQPKLAVQLGSISARDLPRFTEDVLKKYLVAKSNFASFRDYIDTQGANEIREILETYKNVPTFEEDKNYYFDWGSDELFSVANKGPAECSAGLFDMIDVDLSIIRKSLEDYKSVTDDVAKNKLLHEIVFSSSRMLLVTRGAEPRSVTEVYDQFITLFINEGLIDNSYKQLIEKVRNNPSIDLVSENHLIEELAGAIIDLYEGMDDSLQFKTRKAETTSGQVDSEKTLEITSKKIKDLRGVACPMNFVKTKIELSTLNPGSLLEIWLDDGQPIQNVPGSVRNEGHEIISTTQKENYWEILIRKK